MGNKLFSNYFSPVSSTLTSNPYYSDRDTSLPTDIQRERQKADPTATRYDDFQSFAGSDIQALIYLPSITKNTLLGTEGAAKFKIFANLQTISISSTRSVSPVRVFGRSSPIGYTRGARTFAGSLVFATIKKDPFIDVMDSDIGESFVNATTSMGVDQLPPFSILITACNEAGVAASQIIHGVTITNYGTTYSIDDLYTETTYTYVATDVVPLSSSAAMNRQRAARLLDAASSVGSFVFNNLTKLVDASLDFAYGQIGSVVQSQKEASALRQVYGVAETSVTRATNQRDYNQLINDVIRANAGTTLDTIRTELQQLGIIRQ